MSIAPKRCWFAHIRRVVGHFYAQRGYLGLWALHVTKAVEHDVGPLCGQRFGNAQTNTAGRAGNECSFSVQHRVTFQGLIYDVEHIIKPTGYRHV